MEQKKKASTTARKKNPNIVRNEIRFPLDVWEEVKHFSQESHRSRNNEVVHVLKEHYKKLREEDAPT